MRIIMRDDRIFQGTPLQIVRGMKDIAFGVDHLSLSQYVDKVIELAKRFESVDLDGRGSTDEERAASLVESMIKHKLCSRILASSVLTDPGEDKDPVH